MYYLFQIQRRGNYLNLLEALTIILLCRTTNHNSLEIYFPFFALLLPLFSRRNNHLGPQEIINGPICRHCHRSFFNHMKSHEFGGTEGGKICRMAEKNNPLVLKPLIIWKIYFPICCSGLKLGCLIAN